ncbi:MAG: ATP-binding protein [Clostridiales bacterium]|nr:ATP-binding protein [Clostridiales bacterium]
MKKLPLGIQNFRKIREGGYVYVDKTQYVYNIINDGSYYFLSRPRRFGKSLLLDTIGEAFSGDRELFKGLWIYNSDYGFEKHPVIRLDMSNIANRTPDILESSLAASLNKRVSAEGLDITADIPSDIFKFLIEDLHTKYNQRVVVLIDEYDKPILDRLEDIETAKANRDVLKGFYGILKSMDPHLRLTFTTGVSKFTKTSIFSDLNNLLDITLTEEYASICGIATEDLGKHFSEHIEHLAQLEKFKQHFSLNDEILAWYDGYSWDGQARVINPFSLLSFLTQKKFASFWYASGTPKFLMDLIKKDPGAYASLANLKITETMLDSADIDDIEAELLLFQTGYLTVKEIAYDMNEEVFVLGMPNSEVRKAFDLHVAAAFTGKKQAFVKNARLEITEALENGDLHKMLESLRGLFASIPYELHVNREAYYHSVFYAVMNVLGFDIDAEVPVSGGRVDAVMELGDKAYVMEFKYVKCEQGAEPELKNELFEKALKEGMGQIKSRGYAKKYEGSGKKVHLAAFAFLGRDDIEMAVEELI